MARPASDIRARILEAATQQFSQVGVEGASLRAIAREAGSSVGMIAYHFESKDGLFRAVLDRIYDPFLTDLEAVAAAEDDPMSRLVALLRRFAGASELERKGVRTLLREASIDSERVPYVIQRFLRGHVRLIAQALAEAVAAGQIREVPLAGTVPILLAPILVPQMVRHLVGPGLGLDAAAMLDHGIDVMMYGLVPR